MERNCPRSRWARDRRHGRLTRQAPKKNERASFVHERLGVTGALTTAAKQSLWPWRRRSMRWSNLPRWKFTDSCGRPRVPGAMHFGCAHGSHTCHHATRRAFLKGGVAIVSGAGLATIADPRELFAQVRVFPPCLTGGDHVPAACRLTASHGEPVTERLPLVA